MNGSMNSWSLYTQDIIILLRAWAEKAYLLQEQNLKRFVVIKTLIESQAWWNQKGNGAMEVSAIKYHKKGTLKFAYQFVSVVLI